MSLTRFTSLVALASLVSLGVNAESMNFKIQKESSGGTQFRIVGDDLCAQGDATTFSMFKGEVSRGYFTRGEQYASSSGKTEWKVTKSCTINQEVSQSLLEPGKGLEVVTLDDMGYVVNQYYLAVPCDSESTVVTKKYLFSTDVSVIEGTVCSDGQGGTIVKDVEQSDYTVDDGTVTHAQPEVIEEKQQCSLSAQVNREDRNIIDIKAGCEFQDTMELEVISGNTIVLKQVIRVTNGLYFPDTVAQIRRNAARSTDLNIRVYSYDFKERFSKDQLIYKAPTYNHEVNVAVENVRVALPSERKALGRGVYFEHVLTLFAQDGDIDRSQKEIYVQLINTTNGRHDVIRETRATNNQAINFRLEGQYVEPIMSMLFGSGEWDEDGDLQEGLNTFKVRVYDAYSKSQYVDKGNIELIVNKP